MKKTVFALVLAMMAFAGGCATTASNVQPYIKEIAVRDNSTNIKFFPGVCVEYEVSSGDSKISLSPNEYITEWSKGYLSVGHMHAYRPSDIRHTGDDDLFLLTKNKSDFEVDIACHLKDGTTTFRKVIVETSDNPGIILVDKEKIVLGLKKTIEK